MRAVTDSLLISREKLSFLVDATSAPIASLSPISSWIGYEVGLIATALTSIEDSGEDLSCYDSNAFIIFLKTIPSRFYPFLILVVQFILIGEFPIYCTHLVDSVGRWNLVQEDLGQQINYRGL